MERWVGQDGVTQEVMVSRLSVAACSETRSHSRAVDTERPALWEKLRKHEVCVEASEETSRELVLAC